MCTILSVASHLMCYMTVTVSGDELLKSRWSALIVLGFKHPSNDDIPGVVTAGLLARVAML